MYEYDDGPYWAILLIYGSHDMRHTGFRRLTVVNGTPEFWGVTAWYSLVLELELELPSGRKLLSNHSSISRSR